MTSLPLSLGNEGKKTGIYDLQSASSGTMSFTMKIGFIQESVTYEGNNLGLDIPYLINIACALIKKKVRYRKDHVFL